MADPIARFGKDQRPVKPYDFHRPDKFSKDQIKTVQIMHETFARLVTTTLSATLRAMAEVRVACVDQLTYGEFMHSIPAPTIIGIFDMRPLAGSAILELDPAIAFGVIDRLFGGNGDGVPPDREVTDIEHSAMEGVISRMLGDLGEAWKHLVGLEPKLARIETQPQFAELVPPSEMIVLVSLEAKVAGARGMINLAFPYMTIEPIVPMLSAEYWFSRSRRVQAPGAAKAVLERIALFDIEADIYREGGKLALRDIGRLRKGSLVPIPGYGSGEAILRMGGRGVLRLEAGRGRRGRPASYAVKGEAKRQAARAAAAAAAAGEGERKDAIEAALAGALSGLEASLGGALSEISRSLVDLGRRQADMADQLAFGGAESGPSGGLTIPEKARPFDSARRADPALFINFIQLEYPQTIALVLSYLEPQKSSLILAGLPQELQPDVVKRIATMDRVNPEVLREVERVLERKLASVSTEDFLPAGGVDSVVEILNIASRGVERNVVEAMERSDPALAEEIKKRMFVFEDIVLLEPRCFSDVIGRVDEDLLLRAMKAVDEKVRALIWSRIPKAELEGLKARYEAMGRVRLRDVEEAQQAIVATIREMEEAGEIFIERPGDAMA